MTHHVPPVCLWRQVQSLSFSHTHTHTHTHTRINMHSTPSFVYHYLHRGSWFRSFTFLPLLSAPVCHLDIFRCRLNFFGLTRGLHFYSLHSSKCLFYLCKWNTNIKLSRRRLQEQVLNPISGMFCLLAPMLLMPTVSLPLVTTRDIFLSHSSVVTLNNTAVMQPVANRTL